MPRSTFETAIERDPVEEYENPTIDSDDMNIHQQISKLQGSSLGHSVPCSYSVKSDSLLPIALSFEL